MPIPWPLRKFLVFDYFADFIFDLQPALAEKVETQLLVSLLSGAVAGIASSIISQPADTILTRMNQNQAAWALLIGVSARAGPISSTLPLRSGRRKALVASLQA